MIGLDNAEDATVRTGDADGMCVRRSDAQGAVARIVHDLDSAACPVGDGYEPVRVEDAGDMAACDSGASAAWGRAHDARAGAHNGVYGTVRLASVWDAAVGQNSATSAPMGATGMEHAGNATGREVGAGGAARRAHGARRRAVDSVGAMLADDAVNQYRKSQWEALVKAPLKQAAVKKHQKYARHQQRVVPFVVSALGSLGMVSQWADRRTRRASGGGSERPGREAAHETLHSVAYSSLARRKASMMKRVYSMLSIGLLRIVTRNLQESTRVHGYERRFGVCI